MLLLIAVLAFLSAAYMLFRLTRQHHPELSEPNTLLNEPPLNARPLFAPTDDELRREADEDQARVIAKREYAARARSRAAIDDALSAWRSAPEISNAAQLLNVAVEHGLDDDFSRAAHEVIGHFHASGIAGLTRDDLADLLESHIRLLSPQERISGAIFWLKQEVADLRTETV
jgi:hypothetical protein